MAQLPADLPAEGQLHAPHSFALHDNAGVVHMWLSPAPDYRAGDHCDYMALISAVQTRPLALSDLIPGVIYRPGSLLLSRYYPEIRTMTRIVGWVEPALRHDTRAVLTALLEGQAAAGRPTLKRFLTYLAQAKLHSLTDWRVTEADIEQSRIASLIL